MQGVFNQVKNVSLCSFVFRIFREKKRGLGRILEVYQAFIVLNSKFEEILI